MRQGRTVDAEPWDGEAAARDRRRPWRVAAGLAVLLLAGGLAARLDRPQVPQGLEVTTGVTPEPGVARDVPEVPDVPPGTWRWLPASGLGPRLGHTATWVGDAMVIFGGVLESAVVPAGTGPAAVPGQAAEAQPGSAALGTAPAGFGGGAQDEEALPEAAAYRPVSGEWEPLPPSPLGPRSGHVAVWSPRGRCPVYRGCGELVVWGGRSFRPVEAPVPQGATYAPGPGRWTPLPDAPIPARTGAVAVLGEREVFVWGGREAGSIEERGDGAVLDLRTRTWRPVRQAPITADSAHAVWTGAEYVVVTGRDRLEAAAYNPHTETWRVLDPPPLAAANFDVVADGATVFVVGAPFDDLPGSAIYNSVTREWAGIVDPPVSLRGDVTAAWTGSGVVIFDGGELPNGQPIARRLDLEAPGGWEVLAPTRLSPRAGYGAVWTGVELLIWGGVADTDPLDNGAALRLLPP